MAELYVMAGPAGSGKSTYARNELLPKLDKDALLVSTDDIREELTGDAGDQEHNAEVWGLAQKRVREVLKAGKDVVLDATNMSRKDRARTLNQLSGIPDVTKHCVVVLSPVEDCIERQSFRDRQVPTEAIIKQMSRFRMPTRNEGWDDISFYNTCRDKAPELARKLVEQLKGLSQISPWHTEDAWQHTMMVREELEKASEKSVSPLLLEAALAHDVGKFYTRSVDENGSTHFYGHEGVSAYLYLCASVQTEHPDQKILDVEQLIEYHMMAHREAERNKLKEKIGERLFPLITEFTAADSKASVLRETAKEMSLLEFVNFFTDWRNILEGPPFSIKIKEKDGLMLFKYNQLDSDMDYRVVRESRGHILAKLEDEKYGYVCRPFDKFFNHGESHAAAIDWSTARVSEKVDGSLMKMFYYDGQWHLATNKTIDAFQAPIFVDDGREDVPELTFGRVFERNIGMGIQEFGEHLDPSCTYMFELTSPETRVVISYDDGVYYLSRRDTESGREYFDRPELPNVKYPYITPLGTLDAVIDAAKKMTKDEEGFVVNDAAGNRIKIKSPEYLLTAHIANNGHMTKRRIIRLIQEDKTDDLLAYCPQYTDLVRAVENDIRALSDKYEAEWLRVEEKAESLHEKFKEAVKDSPAEDYLLYVDRGHDNETAYGYGHSAKAFLLHFPAEELFRRLGRDEEKDISISDKQIVKAIQEDNLDMLPVIEPALARRAREIEADIDVLSALYSAEWDRVKGLSSALRAQFAMAVGRTPAADYLFRKYEQHNISARELLLTYNTNSIYKYLGYEREPKEKDIRPATPGDDR